MGKHKTESLKSDREINAYVAAQERAITEAKENIKKAETRRQLLMNIENNQVSMFGEVHSLCG